MKRYTEEDKQKALESMEDVGVTQTSEQMGISVQTLYKWRAGARPNCVGFAGKAQEEPVKRASLTDLARVLGDDDIYEEKIKELEAENFRLRRKISKLKQVIIELA